MAEVTVGGDRLGSGNKQTVELHNYGMNSFNLEQDFKSSMAAGILYPFLKIVAMNGDSFDIDLDAFVRTIPTKAPLFGSFKLQADIFSVPIRLYQGMLHNNPTEIGLDMNQIYLPKLNIRTRDGKGAAIVKGSNFYNKQVNESALLKYLGLSGIGTAINQEQGNTDGKGSKIMRKINAVPALAYYDIFKCYYANKQEEYAYVITPGVKESEEETIDNIKCLNDGINYREGDEITPISDTLLLQFKGEGLSTQGIYLTILFGGIEIKGTLREIRDKVIEILGGTYSGIDSWLNEENYNEISPNVIIRIDDIARAYNVGQYQLEDVSLIFAPSEKADVTADIVLTPFKLKNIDDMRNLLLSSNTLGSEFIIDSINGDQGENLMPYNALVNVTEGTEISWNAFIDNGLVVKTYQSDLFNNWLRTAFINKISNLSKVTISQNSFSIDSLNLAEKVYEVLNRIAVSGGTYEDWQEAVWGGEAVRKAETPMYMGGMSSEIMFEEVISSSETKVDGDIQPLGSLGGKGTQVATKGGKNIHIKVEEPSYIMGIVSITPRICYNQGNDWDMTELDTLDDLHKPGMDGIGFQDLITEQMGWWSCNISGIEEFTRHSAGKQTAWINYQTAIDKTFGDFARTEGNGFMALNRNYEARRASGGVNLVVKDLTTYIDPAKYNYAFASTDLASQNFWVQIHSKVIARRKMGAQQIPNL